MKKHRSFNTLLCVFLCAALLLCACSEKPGTVSEDDPQSSATASEGDSRQEPSSAETPDESEISEPESEPEPEPETPFVPVIRFAVASDLHITATSNDSAKRFEKLFRTAYAYAESDESYKSLDAVVLVGDLTNYGRKNEFLAVNTVISRCKKDETQIISVMGNHELYEGGASVYLENMDDSLDKHIVINGIHFIGISPENENGFSSASVKYLTQELEKAAEESGLDTPIIVFQHHHIKDTVYVSSEWYASNSASIKRVLEKYPQVIDFSGHSHGPVNNPTSIWQGKFTALGTGTLSYFEMTSGMTYGTIPPEADRAAQYYIVEIAADGRVKIMPFDILTEDFFKTPSNTDDENETMVYYIDANKDPSLFRYADRASQADEPYFGEGAGIGISGITENTATLSIPQAYDGECIYSYDIDCTDASGTALHFACFSEYYFEPLAESVTYVLTGLEDGTEYTVKVTPYDCYGKKGEPISASFNTLKAPDVEYSSTLDVNFFGTFANFDYMSEVTRSNGTPAYGGKADGDIFGGEWADGISSLDSCFRIDDTHGYEESPCLAVWAANNDNQGLYLIANADNEWSTAFPDLGYLRVWVDFTNVGFRKANFGLMAPDGSLFTTDEEDGRTDQYFWYLAEGSDTWVQYTHGNDGCFGDVQNSDVYGFKGWMAFPIKDFTYRNETGSGTEIAGRSYHSKQVLGVYLFWDYSEAVDYDGNVFYLDEIAIVKDYTVFEPYDK